LPQEIAQAAGGRDIRRGATAAGPS